MDFSLTKTMITNISKVIVGKSEALTLLMTALLADGHVLLEDVPGLGKTLIAKSLAKSFNGIFKRVQFTPDLLPADITGFSIYDQKAGQFKFQAGPVITHILLADEINRAIPRTQASLLESMEERQVTVDGHTHALPNPFFVIATQNPIELEGTFPLPEAQMDRFLLRIQLGYPPKHEEIQILERFQNDDPLTELEAVTDPEQLVRLRQMRKAIKVDRSIKGYIADIVGATRENKALRFGASPRGSLGLMRAAQSFAALHGRDYVLPDDIKHLAQPVLAHRLVLSDDERLGGRTAAQVLDEIIETIAVPV